MTDTVESSGKSPQELSHEILLEAKAALEGGNTEEALNQARRAYEACPNEYPANYNALSTAQECIPFGVTYLCSRIPWATSNGGAPR